MRKFLLATAFAALAAPAHAQFTGGVFGPVVNEGASSAQYRLSIDPDGPAGKTRAGQRVHYQTSLSDRFQLRGVLGTRTTFDVENGELDTDSYFAFDFVQAELTWQVTPDDQTWQSGFRFDGRLRDKGRGHQLGVNWMNQWSFDDGWQARAILLSTLRENESLFKDVGLSGRAQVTKKIESGQTLGLQLYSSLGTAGNFRAFNRGNSTFGGPFVSFPLGDGVSLRTGALIGLTDAAPDTQLRLWLSKGF